MHNEKPNNPLAEKLDGMNSLPEGIVFSANRVWDQLENQLQDKKHKPFMLWLRYAAAIVLLAGAALFWVLQKEVATPKDSFSKQSMEQAPIHQPSPIKTATIPATAAPELMVKKQITVTNNDMVSKQTEPTTIALVPTTIPVETSPIKDTAQRVETIALATISPVLATKPANKAAMVRKRYPVVHLYELYREPEPLYSKSAPKRTITETDESPVAPVETNRSFWLPKPKPVIITTSLTDNQ